MAAEDAKKDKAEIEKLRGSAIYTQLISSLEQLPAGTHDYVPAIKLLAASAIGRCFLAKKFIPAGIFQQLKAAREPTEMARALNSVVGVDASHGCRA